LLGGILFTVPYLEDGDFVERQNIYVTLADARKMRTDRQYIVFGEVTEPVTHVGTFYTRSFTDDLNIPEIQASVN
jgi:hypothetical protein